MMCSFRFYDVYDRHKWFLICYYKTTVFFSEINFCMNIMMGMVTEDTLINYSGMAWSHARIRIADTSTETACQS